MHIYLDRVRTKKNMSIRSLAERSGVSKSQIVRIESGESMPTIRTLCALAKALGVPVGDLFDCDC